MEQLVIRNKGRRRWFLTFLAGIAIIHLSSIIQQQGKLNLIITEGVGTTDRQTTPDIFGSDALEEEGSHSEGSKGMHGRSMW